jgi:hypothetical protein
MTKTKRAGSVAAEDRPKRVQKALLRAFILRREQCNCNSEDGGGSAGRSWRSGAPC